MSSAADPAAWRALAECRDTSPAVFFVSHDANFAETIEHVAAAKAICGRCPVAGECLDFALANYEAGVWGATTEKERREIRAERAAAGRPVARRPAPVSHGTTYGYKQGCRMSCCRDAMSRSKQRSRAS